MTLAQRRREYHRRAQSEAIFQYEGAWAPYFYDRCEQATIYRPASGAEVYCFRIGAEEVRLFPGIVTQCGKPRRPADWIGFEVGEGGGWYEVVLSEEDGAAITALESETACRR